MKRSGGKRRTIIIILISIVLVLLLLGVYLLWIKPSLNGLVVLGMKQGYNQGYADSVVFLLQQLSTCSQPVPVTFGNYTLNVVALECVK